MNIRDYLQSRQIPFRTILHRPVSTASRRAQSVHVSGGEVAKAVLIEADDRFVLVVLPATHRIDLMRLAEVLGSGRVRLATEEDAQRVFHDCERGAVPPFGKLYGLGTLVDASLTGAAEIVVESNLRHEALRLSFADFEAIEAPERACFGNEIAPRRRRLTPRRAG